MRTKLDKESNVFNFKNSRNLLAIDYPSLGRRLVRAPIDFL